MREGFTTLVVESLAGTVALVVAFVAFVRLRLRPRIDRDVREVAEARRCDFEADSVPSRSRSSDVLSNHSRMARCNAQEG